MFAKCPYCANEIVTNNPNIINSYNGQQSSEWYIMWGIIIIIIIFPGCITSTINTYNN